LCGFRFIGVDSHSALETDPDLPGAYFSEIWRLSETRHIQCLCKIVTTVNAMLLRIGSRGDAVRQLQNDINQLRDDGNLSIPAALDVDGIYGDLTGNAVIRFQKDQGLQVDGVAGDQTLGRIADALERHNTPVDAKPPVANEAASLIQKLLTIAQKEIGTREVGGNNCGVRIREYQRSTQEAPGVWPWCAAFVDWSVREWVAQPDVRAALGWSDNADNQRPRTARAFDYIDWGRYHKQAVHPPSIRPEPGMLAVYEFSHIGIVKAAIEGDRFIAIEGNTNASGDRDSASGDGVWEKVRHNSLVRNFIAWRFVQSASADEKTASRALPTNVSTATRGIGSIPRECLEFIVDQEGMDQPWIFPGGSSGITLGHGYDLYAEPDDQLRKDWTAFLTSNQLDRLSAAVGKNGAEAETFASTFKDITISVDAGDAVFFAATVPKYYNQMLSGLPGVDQFPGEVQGALLSLVFNRGSSIKGERRKEMKEIQTLIATGQHDAQTLGKIAAQLREMKRLWVGKGLDGLLARREAEARMVESAIV
jgi:hypothetical protein